MPDITFNVRSWAGWVDGAIEPQSQTPSLLRRRVTTTGQKALNLAWSLPDGAEARYIFSSRHGEFERTLSLMTASTKGEESSPADFTLSVHHALVGLLSIAQHNRRGHSAISAGADSFCFALIEAAACLAENPSEQVMLIHCDTPLPAPYDAFAEASDTSVVIALMLTADGSDSFKVTQSWDSATGGVTDNHAVAFLDFLSKGEASRQSQGLNHCWQWTRHAPA